MSRIECGRTIYGFNGRCDVIFKMRFTVVVRNCNYNE